MKIRALIEPRRDGSLTLQGEDGDTYRFTRDDNGDMVCEIVDAATIAKALAGGNFIPVDEQDFKEAESILAAVAEEEHDDLLGDDDEDEGNDMALPVEANTPPKRFKKPRKATE